MNRTFKSGGFYCLIFLSFITIKVTSAKENVIPETVISVSGHSVPFGISYHFNDHKPFRGKNHQISGIIQAENYDEGGDEIAYHHNIFHKNRKKYRDDEIDIEESGDPEDPKGYDITGFDKSDWVIYSVDIEDGNYDMYIRVGAMANGTRLNLFIDNKVIGQFEAPENIQKEKWYTLPIRNVYLGGKNRNLRLECQNGSCSVNWLQFKAAIQPPKPPVNLSGQTNSDNQIDLVWDDKSNDEDGFIIERKNINNLFDSIGAVSSNVTAYSDKGLIPGKTYTYQVKAFNLGGVSGYSNAFSITLPQQKPYKNITGQIPGRIEAENYDEGGELIAYHDKDPNNTGKKYRNDGVDIRNSEDPDDPDGFDVGWFSDLEWMEYTVNVKDGIYDISIRVEAKSFGKQLGLLLDNKLVGEFEVPKLTGKNKWATVTIKGVALAGGNNKILKLLCEEGQVDVNWLEFKYLNTKPESPAGLRGQIKSDTRIDLLWVDKSDNEKGFIIERKSESSLFDSLTTVSQNATTYMDLTVLPGKTYTYRVKAYNLNGYSGYSNELPVKIRIISINTTMLGSKYNFTTSGAVADSIKVYETGTTAKIAFISDSVLTSLPEITIQFTPKDNGQKFTDKLLVTDSLEIRQVLFEHLGNALPLSNQFYSIKNNEISFFPGQKILKSDVLILGIKGNVRIPGEDIIISGLEKFTGANMIVYNANNRTSPIRTISGTLKWDCKDNTGTSVTPGVYLLVININDGSGKVLNNQIIIK